VRRPGREWAALSRGTGGSAGFYRPARCAIAANALAGVTSAVQLGFIADTLLFAIFNVVDRWRPRDVFLACAVLGAGANLAVLALPALVEGRYTTLLALRFATGFFLAGVYPVGMKIAASWYQARCWGCWRAGDWPPEAPDSTRQRGGLIQGGAGGSGSASMSATTRA